MNSKIFYQIAIVFHMHFKISHFLSLLLGCGWRCGLRCGLHPSLPLRCWVQNTSRIIQDLYKTLVLTSFYSTVVIATGYLVSSGRVPFNRLDPSEPQAPSNPVAEYPSKPLPEVATRFQTSRTMLTPCRYDPITYALPCQHLPL